MLCNVRRDSKIVWSYLIIIIYCCSPFFLTSDHQLEITIFNMIISNNWDEEFNCHVVLLRSVDHCNLCGDVAHHHIYGASKLMDDDLRFDTLFCVLASVVCQLSVGFKSSFGHRFARFKSLHNTNEWNVLFQPDPKDTIIK